MPAGMPPRCCQAQVEQRLVSWAGVPALLLYFGDQVAGSAGGPSSKQLLDQYLGQRYHRPGDDLSQHFDYSAGARMLGVFARTLVSVANSSRAPQWKAGAPYRRR